MSKADILDDHELTKDLRVYALADMFQMERLKEQAFGRFETKIQQLWISDMFIDYVKEVYSTTNSNDRMMRGAVVGIAVKHIRELWKKQQFRGLVREVGDFAEDMIGALPNVGDEDVLDYP
ncbi:hypothetical protein ACJ73_08959 [Blastomyces percursus]|uniref:Uncharacterized protein n=1 Tax=Blastomyces percursus TaxID=1658174 RepID=A0A1J9PH05_9EURO|nr:hypothetical protein ACJ73_08959 [Blastomyces percursus]